MWPRWPGGKVSTSGPEGSKLDSTEEPPCKWVWCTLNTSGPNVFQLVRCGSLERGVPAQVLSSSSDRGTKLRGPPQNSPRVASRRDANITMGKTLDRGEARLDSAKNFPFLFLSYIFQH
ncbi:hypothetical protein AVEN_17585-1 [Araneus ventricosus]|uniref:Uncharacterized protein n=1 Tax=Araneus ventricosus TaxID=182803 RepID=A0A4Y2K139_ARAVE|nr:hypothetical protein AVEN_17585-1 [Araneus ventricosus]